MPRWVPVALMILASLALVPIACIARSRVTRSSLPRIHVVPDMDNQSKYKSQQANSMFADRRAMRLPVQGTVARGMLQEDDHYFRGVVDGEYATRLPVMLTPELLDRGRRQYDIYCAPCHGLAGYGDGMIAKRAVELQQGTFVPPASLHDEPASSRADGHLFNTISNGIRTMPSYGSQVEVADRWAIVAYLRALQRSQRTTIDDVPPELRASVKEIQP